MVCIKANNIYTKLHARLLPRAHAVRLRLGHVRRCGVGHAAGVCLVGVRVHLYGAGMDLRSLGMASPAEGAICMQCHFKG